MDLASATAATFSDHVGQPFEVSAGDGVSHTLALASVREGAAAPWPGARVPFVLVFEGPREPLLPQAIYGFTHPDLGEFGIFIVPVGIEGEAVVYEAVFN
jgi:hypothetical protein